MSGKVVVVGHCASGKSSVVRMLRDNGVDASAVAQEHSVIEDLWDHNSPDHVIFLDVSLEQVRERRDNPNWPRWLYDVQEKRLAGARERADLVVDTSNLDLPETLRRVVRFLEFN